ncbi:hypothetical protein B8V60_06965 [Streptococcus agalactiae]|uniref:hypothetical protein n=1 Tax=Streptococcus agalactiae TaxID=1311 RepID=UPI001375199C|nr:hypothetical protein [Streptococcus agalactiae]KAF1242509.1 hypothetical protein B8V60_06965 [Streptococcus agalactiae]
MDKTEIPFESSANFLYDSLIIKILSWLHSNNTFQYQLLYRKDYENSNNESDEPYFYHSKQLAKETMSRILNHKKKLNNNIYKTICQNMEVNPVAFLFSFEHLSNYDNEVMYFFNNDFKFLFNKILEDAFISETYFKFIIELFKDNVRFSKYLIDSEPELSEDYIFQQYSDLEKSYKNDQSKRIEFLNDPEFAEIFWETSVSLLNKLESSTFDETEYTKNLATRVFDFFESKDKLLLKFPKIIEDLFIFLKNNYFTNLIPNKDHTSLGLLGYNLLKFQVKKEQEQYRLEIGDFNANLITDKAIDKKWFTKRQIALSCLQFVDQISKYQIELISQDNFLALEIENRRKALFLDEEYEQEAEIKAISDLSIQCTKCRFKNIIECNEINNTIIKISSIEQSMGFRTTYQTHSTRNCRHCNNKMDILIFFDEYPALVIDSIQLIQHSGCRIISLPQFEFTIY